jgi:hypothetical protein
METIMNFVNTGIVISTIIIIQIVKSILNC